MSRNRRKSAPDYQIKKIKKDGKHLPDGRTDNFIRIYASLFESQKFIELTGTAKSVYIAIALQCGREDLSQKMECKLPESQYKKLGFTKKQFIVAVKALECAGFIDVGRFRNRQPSIYKLSDRWKL